MQQLGRRRPASLTTVAQSLRDQGARCARTALGHLTPADRDTEVAWHLVGRESTRRPRRGR
ncbi:hypothetical protein AB0G15_32610 [Streptosporangium sp. NPDC023825]|uniref:hypothetical protein n=1 Tax=Streptosporangium sp. NPDC023825 TaxID=3154909 RepID=UPI00341F1238